MQRNLCIIWKIIDKGNSYLWTSYFHLKDRREKWWDMGVYSMMVQVWVIFSWTKLLFLFFWAINHFGAITVKLMKTLYSDMHSITAFQLIIDHMDNDRIITTIYKIHHWLKCYATQDGTLCHFCTVTKIT